MATITDIAKVTGYSISTVSKAFSNSTDINEATRADILRNALEMGYEIKPKISKLKGKIAVLTESAKHISANKFEHQMLFGFQLEAMEAGYEVALIQRPSYSPDWSFVENIANKNFTGAFVMRVNMDSVIYRELESIKYPCVLFDNYIDNETVAAIGCDNSIGIKLSVQHLVSLGHKKIAFFGGTPTAEVSRLRRKGFIDAMRSLGVVPQPELIIETDFFINMAHTIIPDFLAAGATAVVCASDLLAKYVIDALKAIGLSVPNDISVVGFDNVPLAEEITPKLTTISQNSVELGKNAFYLLSKLIKGIGYTNLTMRPKLIVRDSTKSIFEK